MYTKILLHLEKKKLNIATENLKFLTLMYFQEKTLFHKMPQSHSVTEFHQHTTHNQ